MSIFRTSEASIPSESKRVLLFGTQCHMTRYVLSCLVETDHRIVGLVLSGQHPEPVRQLVTPTSDARKIRMAHPSSSWTVQSIAEQYGIPLYSVRSFHHQRTRETLASLAPDVTCIACFAKRLPLEIINIARFGAINLHPSLLPALRGPDPLFWTYRLGLKSGGVSVHQVLTELDAGPILEQTRVSIPRGLPGDELEQKISEIASELLITVLQNLKESLAMAQPQPELCASYYSWPEYRDLMVIPEKWTIEDAQHFINGVRPIGYRPLVEVEGILTPVRSVRHSLDASSPDEMLVHFADGPGLAFPG